MAMDTIFTHSSTMLKRLDESHEIVEAKTKVLRPRACFAPSFPAMWDHQFAPKILVHAN